MLRQFRQGKPTEKDFLNAAKKSDLSTVNDYLKANGGVIEKLNVVDENDNTALLLAIKAYCILYNDRSTRIEKKRENSLKIITRLLDYPGTNVNFISKQGEAALHCAYGVDYVCHDSSLLMALLAHKGIDVNIVARSETLSHRKDINDDKLAKEAMTILQLVVSHELAGREHDFKLLGNLLNKGANINQTVSSDDQHPVCLAIHHGNYAAAQWLLRQASFKLTPSIAAAILCEAIACDHEEICEEMLNYNKIAINAFAKEGRTPLTAAICYNNTTALDALLARPDIDINRKDGIGEMPLIVAIVYKQKEALNKMLDRDDIDVNAKNTNNLAPLHVAIKNRQLQVVKQLLDRDDIDINATNDKGETPLIALIKFEMSWMCGGDNLEKEKDKLIKTIVKRSDVDFGVAPCGKTPYTVARECGNDAMARRIFAAKKAQQKCQSATSLNQPATLYHQPVNDDRQKATSTMSKANKPGKNT